MDNAFIQPHEQQPIQPVDWPFAAIQERATVIAKSGMMGTNDPNQVMTLMMIAQSENLHPMLAVRRFHIIEGKPSMKSETMAGEFEHRGGQIFWHIRTDTVAAATFFADASKVDDKAIARAKDRCTAILNNKADQIVALSYPGEETIVRTFADCEKKGLTVSVKWEGGQKKETKKKNWYQSPRQMLTARVITEGVGLMKPGIKSGIYEEDEVRQIIDNEHEALLDRAMDRSSERVDQGIVDKEKERLRQMGMDPSMAEPADFSQKPVESSGEQSAVSTLPEGEAPAGDAVETEVLPPERSERWEDYRICQMKSVEYAGKHLRELNKTQLSTLWKKRCIKHLESEDAGLRREALMVQKAFQAWEEAEAKEAAEAEKEAKG